MYKEKQILNNAARFYSNILSMNCYACHAYVFKHKFCKKTNKILVKYLGKDILVKLVKTLNLKS